MSAVGCERACQLLVPRQLRVTLASPPPTPHASRQVHRPHGPRRRGRGGGHTRVDRGGWRTPVGVRGETSDLCVYGARPQCEHFLIVPSPAVVGQRGWGRGSRTTRREECRSPMPRENRRCRAPRVGEVAARCTLENFHRCSIPCASLPWCCANVAVSDRNAVGWCIRVFRRPVVCGASHLFGRVGRWWTGGEVCGYRSRSPPQSADVASGCCAVVVRSGRLLRRKS